MHIFDTIYKATVLYGIEAIKLSLLTFDEPI